MYACMPITRLGKERRMNNNVAETIHLKFGASIVINKVEKIDRRTQ